MYNQLGVWIHYTLFFFSSFLSSINYFIGIVGNILDSVRFTCGYRQQIFEYQIRHYAYLLGHKQLRQMCAAMHASFFYSKLLMGRWGEIVSVSHATHIKCPCFPRWLTSTFFVYTSIRVINAEQLLFTCRCFYNEPEKKISTASITIKYIIYHNK